MFRRACPLLLLAAFALTGRAHADERLVGAYAVEGRSADGVAYVGSARIAAEGQALVLHLERADVAAVSAPLRAADGEWRLAVEVSAVGLSGALAGADGAPVMLEARYRVVAAGLEGRWRLRRDETTLARGQELLRRQPLVDRRPRVRVAVSVDWEGRGLRDVDIRAMEAFRAALPDVPLTHFLNAAYFTKDGADAAAIAETMRRVVLPGDERGLHIHAWRSLIERSGVSFRTRPTFWGGPVHPSGAGDVGHDVEIAAYTVEELERVVATSRELLAAAGFPLSGSFRAGGWMAAPNVLEAIRAQGFAVDSSATDPVWHDELEGYRLRRRIGEVWEGVFAETQPYWVETPAGRILEMPDTCALADYVTPHEMVEHVRAAVARFQAAGGERDVFVHVGFHQETAARYAGRVREAIELLRELDPEAPLVFETLEASAGRARALLAD